MSELDIDPVIWATLNRLLDEALDLQPEERAAWLERLPQDHEALKARLERMLSRAAESTGALLGTLPKLTEEAGGEGSGAAGRRLGPYRLTKPLAEGGMGAVWLAERQDGMVLRPVALKLPHGSWARPGLWQRMAREREILASLNHPHIAHLYDAGLSESGQPYLALEYVQGRPIDDYAKQFCLDISARLRLFLQVVWAVAYAHGQLVVHRDIKPSNILVTDGGEVKLLDFGIAKLLESGLAHETELTEAAGRALTLGYASPEQILGEPIGVASDVYSLSVVLFELLAERRPYQPKSDSRASLEEAILHVEPPKPSDVASQLSSRRQLKGDLDTIVSMGLKKRPHERYATANALAEDISRYLDGRPVLAQPDRRGYRIRKFVGRNRFVVGAAAAILTAIVGGAALAFWQARVAFTERERAEEVKELIASIFQDANLDAGEGSSLTALELLKRASSRLDRSLEASVESRVELLNILGSSLLSLGDTETTEEVLTRAVDESTRAFGPDHIVTVRARLARTWPLMYRGKIQQMREELDALVPAVERNPSAEPRDAVLVWRLRAACSIEEGNYAQAVLDGEKALQIAEQRLSPDDSETFLALVSLANAYTFENRSEQALVAARRAHQRAPLVYPENPTHPNVILARTQYGRALGANGDFEGAIELLEQVLNDKIELHGPTNRSVGMTHQNLVSYQLMAGRLQAALEHSERALAILSEHANPASPTIAATRNSRGLALLRSRQGARALADLKDARDAASELFGATHRNSVNAGANHALASAYAGDVAGARREVDSLIHQLQEHGEDPTYSLSYVNGVLLRIAGDYEGAIRSQEAALALALRESGPYVEVFRAWSSTEVGVAKLETGSFGEATESLEEALVLFERFRSVLAPDHVDALVGLGRAHIGRKEVEEALPLLERADAFWREFDAENRWAGEAALWLGRCYAELGRDDDAKRAFMRAAPILTRSPLPGDSRLAPLAR